MLLIQLKHTLRYEKKCLEAESLNAFSNDGAAKNK